MTEMMERQGRQFARTDHGGWLEVGARLPEGSRAKICGDAVVFEEAARNMNGGVFRGGVFRGGVFRGGEFYGGEFYDGVFRGGVFRGGEFWGGVFWGGEFRGGVFNCSPACAQRSDGYMFVCHRVGDELRIWAGCHNFSWEQAVAHWNDGHRHGKESQRIIHFLRAQVEARGDATE